MARASFRGRAILETMGDEDKSVRHGAAARWIHSSGSTRRGEHLAATEFLAQGRSARGGRGSAILGRQGESSHAVSGCHQPDGDKSAPDFRAARRLLQHLTRRDEPRAVDAPARAAGRQSEEQPPTKRGCGKRGAGLRSSRHASDRHCAGEVRLCSNCNPSQTIDLAFAMVGSSGHQLRSLLQRVQCSCPRCVDCR
jgi:hypothetical protein